MAGMAGSSSEREPLLRRPSRAENPALPEDCLPRPDKKRKWLPSFNTIHPRYKWIPLLGCIIIFTNEAEYFTSQVAQMRAIESMYCYNHYLALESPLAELGTHIPERLCKDDSIQKSLAKTSGLLMFVRMTCALIGAVPLGWLSDRSGRKVVLILHKVNVTITCAFRLCICAIARPIRHNLANVRPQISSFRRLQSGFTGTAACQAYSAETSTSV